MRVLSAYRFKNSKEIRVEHVTKSEARKHGVPECDSLALVFDMEFGIERLFIRPDEAVIIINLLSDALYKSVKGYDVGLLRGYNGFDR
jgi:hypothetical protein